MSDISSLSREETQILLCIAKNIDPEARPQSRHYIFCPSIGVRLSWLIQSSLVAVSNPGTLTIIYIPVYEVADPKFDPKELQTKIEVALSGKVPAGAEFYNRP